MKTTLKTFFFVSASLATVLFSPFIKAQEAVIAKKATESLLLDVEKLPNGRLVAVGERGHILLSDDSGATWSQSPSPTNVNLTAVDFFDDNHGVAVGFDQTILLTADSGQSWQIKYQSDSMEQPALFDVAYTNNDNIVAVGSYGLYLQSEDGGENWQDELYDSLADSFGGFSHFYSIVPVNDQYWIMAGEKFVSGETEDFEEISSGLIAETRDGGETWTKLPSPYKGSFFGAGFHNNKLYVYGLRGHAYQSTDQGQNWQNLNLDTEAGLHKMAFMPNGQWVLVGTGGELIRETQNAMTISKRSDLKGRAAVVAVDDSQLVIVGEGGVERVSLAQENLQKEAE